MVRLPNDRTHAASAFKSIHKSGTLRGTISKRTSQQTHSTISPGQCRANSQGAYRPQTAALALSTAADDSREVWSSSNHKMVFLRGTLNHCGQSSVHLSQFRLYFPKIQGDS